MKLLLTIILCSISYIGFSQVSLSEENAKTIIKVFFEGFHTGDTMKMKSVMMPSMMMQTAYVSKLEGNKVSYSRGSDFLKAIAGKDKETRWEEKILDVRLETDGNIANIWTPYKFYVNGKFSYCGANSFTLVFTEESWKILNIIDSRRIDSCDK